MKYTHILVQLWHGGIMSKLFVCRHTETVYNKEDIFSGRLDTPLSDKGILQAREMAAKKMMKR